MLATDGYGCLGGIAQYNRDVLSALDACPLVETARVWPRNLTQPIAEPIPEAIIYERCFVGGKWRYVVNALSSLVFAPPYDLVICAHLHLLPLAWLAAIRRGAPLALAIYGIEAWRPTGHALTDFFARRIDWLVSISALTEQRFRDWARPAAQSVRIAPCVDLERFQTGERPVELAMRYGVTGRRVMMTVGRLGSGERYKGFDEVIEILPRLSRDMPDICYLIVGDGDDRARLEEKTRDLGVGDCVIFTGAISEAEKVDHYRLADLYVMPSSGEGFGIVLIEAAATGAALIGSVADGTREALLEGKLGALVDPSRPETLYAAITDALRVPTPRRRNAAVQTWSRDAFNRRVHDWLAQIPLTP